MISSFDDDDFDLRYLQASDFLPGDSVPWTRPRNLFEQRLMTNLQPGLVLMLDLDVIARLLAGAAVANAGQILTVDMILGSDLNRVEVVSLVRDMVPIYADVAGNFEPALRWYHAHGERRLRVSVIAPGFFWLPIIDHVARKGERGS
jgi:hypothetical protein